MSWSFPPHHDWNVAWKSDLQRQQWRFPTRFWNVRRFPFCFNEIVADHTLLRLQITRNGREICRENLSLFEYGAHQQRNNFKLCTQSIAMSPIDNCACVSEREEEFLKKKKKQISARSFWTTKTSARPVARIFVWGGRGGGGCVPREPGPNILMFEWYAMQVPKIHRAEWRTYGVIEIGTSFNATGKTCERRRRDPLGGSGGMPPSPPPPHPPSGKFSNLKALKCHFQHSRAESCVKKVPKIDRYFLLNLTKKGAVIRCDIFS